jgi:predicted PurR-regulated permease PerM
MKKILNFFKTLLSGILPALLGGFVCLEVWYIYNNIVKIATGNGWSVVLSFILAVIEFILVIVTLYEMGELAINAKRWKKYLKSKEEEIVNNIDGSSDDCETSDEAADI